MSKTLQRAKEKNGKNGPSTFCRECRAAGTVIDAECTSPVKREAMANIIDINKNRQVRF